MMNMSTIETSMKTDSSLLFLKCWEFLSAQEGEEERSRAEEAALTLTVEEEEAAFVVAAALVE